ncbi:MAG: hypothetical protein IKR69_02610 [Bacteroidales bacterium]|nr:hypothetical protein [Bacteroidales bacterium]
MDKMVISNDEFFAEVKRLLASERKVTIPVKGYSMLPFIRGGKDLVVLEPENDYRPGDIVLFYVGREGEGRYVMHRIIRLEERKGTMWAVIRGDGVLENTEQVPLSSVIARAVTVLRDGKRPVDPRSPGHLRKVRFWDALRPFRRYILFVYKHLPWNIGWVRQNY